MRQKRPLKAVTVIDAAYEGFYDGFTHGYEAAFLVLAGLYESKQTRESVHRFLLANRRRALTLKKGPKYTSRTRS